MTRTLVIGASGGIGGALATAAQARGDRVTTLSRSADGIDLMNEASVEGALASLDGTFDTILVATGALQIGEDGPEKSLGAINPHALAVQFALNAIGPALVLKHALRLLPRGRRAVFAALSARVGSIGDNRLGGWYAYRAAKAALNQLVHTAAIEIARTRRHAICVTLHPGTVATELSRGYPDHTAVPPAEAAANLLGVIGGLTPADTGRFFDWAGKEIPW